MATLNKGNWAREMAQLVKCLLCKHEDLSLIPKIHVQMLGAAEEVHNPSPGEAEAGGLTA